MNAETRPFTTGQRAALDADLRTTRQGATSFTVLTVALGFTITLITQRSLDLAWRVGLLSGAAGALIGGVLWLAAARRHSAARSSDSAQHYSGPLTITKQQRRHRVIWRIEVERTVITLPRYTGALDKGWLVAGQAIGTVLYSPEARYLFAAWAADGRLVYRAREYDLDADLVPGGNTLATTAQAR